MPDLDVALTGGALWITLRRPEVLNALTTDMADRLAAALEDAHARADVRVVVLTGAGTAFCTGADVSAGGSAGDAPLDVTALDRANRIVRAITSCSKPVVAAVNGVAAGVGCSAALACDLVVAASSASFLLAFTRVGLMPDGGASLTVAASVGRARAMRMALLAEPLPAADALAAGLVTHVVPDAELAPTVAAVVARLEAGPPLAFAATKKAINAATLADLEPALARERTGQAVLLRTADLAEGLHAFTRRRPPVFRGE